MQECAPPAVLPDKALDAGDVARGWEQDRAALADCGRGKAALVDAVKVLRGQE